MAKYKADIHRVPRPVPKQHNKGSIKQPAKRKPQGLSHLSGAIKRATNNKKLPIECPICAKNRLGRNFLRHLLNCHEQVIESAQLSKKRRKALAQEKRWQEELKRKRAKKRQETDALIARYGSLVKAKVALEIARIKKQIKKQAREDKKRRGGVLDPSTVRAPSGNISYATPKLKR